MNPVYIIGIVALGATAVSVIRELIGHVSPVKQLPTETKYMGTVFLRFIHYALIAFSVGFFLFFRGANLTKFWILLELAVLYTIVLGWFVFGCCSLSYLEMMFYDVKVSKYDSGVNPTFLCLFSPFQKQIKSLFGIMYLVNIALIFFMRPDILSLPVKIAYIVSFLYFYIGYGVIPSLFEHRNYPDKHPILNAVQRVYERYF